MTITSCGNFAVAGMSTGHIELFNMQSGLHRGELGWPRGECGILQSLSEFLLHISYAANAHFAKTILNYMRAQSSLYLCFANVLCLHVM